MFILGGTPTTSRRGRAVSFDPVVRRRAAIRAANSGHMQGILNPPGNPKANYVENPKLSSDPRAWYYDANHVEGSWWPQWLEWVQQRSGVQRETLMPLGATRITHHGSSAGHLRAGAMSSTITLRRLDEDLRPRILRQCAWWSCSTRRASRTCRPVDEVANEMGISPGNLYYHFHGKEPLVLGLFERFQSELAPLLDPPADAQLEAEDYWLFLHLIVERMAHYRFLFQDLSNLAGRLPKLAKGIRNLLTALKRTLASLLARLKAAGQLAAATPRRWGNWWNRSP